MYYIKLLLIASITVFDTIKVLLVMLFKGSHIFHAHSHKWSKLLLKISGIKLNVSGKEKIDKSKSHIYVANHASLYDIPILLAGLDDNVCIMYKKELEKIPIFGYGLKKSPFISIVRSDPRKALESIQNSLKTLKDGDSLFIFPEGTRTTDGSMTPFKRGAFMIASMSGLPIVPVSIKGSFDILSKDKKAINNTTIELIIHDPIQNNEKLSRTEEKELMNQVHQIIETSLLEGKKENK